MEKRARLGERPGSCALYPQPVTALPIQSPPCDGRGAAGYASPRYRRIITEGVPRLLYMHLRKTHDGMTFRVIRHDATPFCGLHVDCLLSGATKNRAASIARA